MTPSLADLTARVWRLRLSIFVVALSVPLLGGCGSPSGRDGNSTRPLFESLDDDDLLMADRALQQALNVAISETTFAWRNTANGHSGTVTPKNSFRTDEGRYCRTYVETVTIDRRSELYENTACIDDSGVWKSVR